MRKTYRIINLVKQSQIYSNLALEEAINKFNQEQENIYLDFQHYDLDNFVLLMHDNQLKIAYSSQQPQREVYHHPEDVYASQQLAEQAKQGKQAEQVAQDGMSYFDASNVDFVLSRFGPQFNHNGFAVVQAFEMLGVSVANGITGLRNCRDKWQCYLLLKDLVPLVNSSFMNWKHYLTSQAELFAMPQITKPNAFSMGGNQINLAYTQKQLAKQSLAMQSFDFTLAQEFIKSFDARNYDLRIMVLNGEVTGAFLRVSQANKIAANIAQGGYGIPYQITPELEAQALAIVERLGLDLSGLDFVYNQEYKQWQFLEANANPGFFAYDKVLQQNFAENILDYLLIRLTGHNLAYFQSPQEINEQVIANFQKLDRQQALQWQQTYARELATQQQAQVDQAVAQATAQQLKENLIAQGIHNADELVALHTGIDLSQELNQDLEPQSAVHTVLEEVTGETPIVPDVPVEQEPKEQTAVELPVIETDESQLIFAPDLSFIEQRISKQKSIIEQEQRDLLTQENLEEVKVVTFDTANQAQEQTIKLDELPETKEVENKFTQVQLTSQLENLPDEPEYYLPAEVPLFYSPEQAQGTLTSLTAQSAQTQGGQTQSSQSSQVHTQGQELQATSFALESKPSSSSASSTLSSSSTLSTSSNSSTQSELGEAKEQSAQGEQSELSALNIPDKQNSANSITDVLTNDQSLAKDQNLAGDKSLDNSIDKPREQTTDKLTGDKQSPAHNLTLSHRNNFPETTDDPIALLRLLKQDKFDQ
ncbi:RimK family alpha-L-glutamate ligase [Psittacicella hinzii]|nr:hypothetical protein [Psittacicella hinzii]